MPRREAVHPAQLPTVLSRSTTYVPPHQGTMTSRASAATQMVLVAVTHPPEGWGEAEVADGARTRARTVRSTCRHHWDQSR